MTRKVAEKIARGIADKIECNTVDIDDWAEFWGFTREEYEEFLDLAMKALEQEPILDKIRAEIIKYEGDCRLSVDEYPSCKQCTDNVFKTIYGILDKYKAESEGTNV
jgi:hypothetical protein